MTQHYHEHYHKEELTCEINIRFVRVCDWGRTQANLRGFFIFIRRLLLLRAVIFTDRADNNPKFLG